MLTAAALRKLLSYNPVTGIFTRSGRVAGCRQSAGYWHIRLNGERYLSHRLAWLYVRGEWPQADIDHINGDRLDNRITNLRLASRSQNNANMKASVRSPMGLKGIRQDKRNSRWYARIQVGGKSHCLGGYSSAEEANSAYLAASKHFFGEFARAV